MNKWAAIGLNITGLMITLGILFMGFLKLGSIPVLLFVFFCTQALQDAIRGRVNVFSFAPIIVVPLIYGLEIFVKLFGAMFGVLTVIWLVIHVLRKNGKIPEGELLLGFGDVLGIPYYLMLSWILLPFWGLIISQVVTLTMFPVFLRKKNRRLLPWLLPGILVVFMIAVFF